MKPRVQLPIAARLVCGLLAAGTALAQTPSGSAAPRMKAIVHSEYGSPDVLRLEEVERCVPNDNQVLVKVRAASVNPLDWHYLRGTPYLVRTDAGLLRPKNPRLGVDLAGQVEAIGKNVTRFKPGDEVFGSRFGAFAEYACAAEKSLAPKPPNVTFEQAAAVPVAALTALQGLRDRGKLQPGQKVLVNGASGGVGTFAVQIAKALGAHVTGVCSTRNVELVRSLGADRVIDYTKEDFTRGEQQYDVILDMIGNHSLSECRRVLAPTGKLVLVGSTEKGRWLGPMKGAIKAAFLSPFVSQEMGFMLTKTNPGDLAVVGDLLREGRVKPVIDRSYKLSQAPDAVRYLEGGHARGKVVITVGDEGDAPPIGAGAASSSSSTRGLASVLALAIAVLALPVVAAFALNRGFQRRNPGKRPYRWGYYVALMSFLAGTAVGLALESGAAVAIACAAIYALLAWFFALRHRWAWVALTILSFNPLAWVINFVYLRKRWREDAVPAPAS